MTVVGFKGGQSCKACETFRNTVIERHNYLGATQCNMTIECWEHFFLTPLYRVTYRYSTWDLLINKQLDFNICNPVIFYY